MDYNQIYKSYYTRYYDKFEKKIKQIFIDNKAKHTSFGLVLNNLLKCLDKEIPVRTVINGNENLKNFQKIFNNRYSYYDEDLDQGIMIDQILKNQIKPDFEILTDSFLTDRYSFDDLIREIALLNVCKEIRRLLQNHSSLFEMFYKTKMFNEFEIRDYSGIGLEQSEIFIKLNKILYPDYYENIKNIRTSVVEIESVPAQIQKKQSDEIETIKFNLSKFSEDEKIFLLHACYNAKTKLPQTEFAKLMLITSGIEDISIFYENQPGNNKLYRKFNEGIEYISESKRREFINNVIQKIQNFNLKTFNNELGLIKKNVK